MLTDTSSAAAATTPVVGAAALVVAVLIVEPILAKFDAAAETVSGIANTNDIRRLQQQIQLPMVTGLRSPSVSIRQRIIARREPM
ncbi:hypothetical protein [Mycobacterium alsense]|uniref:hypothetical protein n=1 Tax=Mycobacterium alsense TaxID=324058 RepID=UPI001FD1FEC0|nr:hypothetical protein [Mycobacterium alsense]